MISKDRELLRVLTVAGLACMALMQVPSLTQAIGVLEPSPLQAGLHACNLGVGRDVAPGKSNEPLLTLIQQHMDCQNKLLSSLDETLILLDEAGEGDADLIDAAIELASAAKSSIAVFQTTLADPASYKGLDADFEAALFDLEMLELSLDAIRDGAEQASLEFQNANQKASQYVNLLSRLLKTMNEMANGVPGNIR